MGSGRYVEGKKGIKENTQALATTHRRYVGYHTGVTLAITQRLRWLSHRRYVGYHTDVTLAITHIRYVGYHTIQRLLEATK